MKSRKRLVYKALDTFAPHAGLLCDVNDTDFRAQNTESISSMCVDADLLCDVTDTDFRDQNTKSILSMCTDIEMCLLTA